ncbi:MAG: hypothetical protein KAX44_01045 [Candidatus Brocadiae bacterium]|nr:hypothetical protein [Candidatus Brocadiia bacterium]
MAKLSHRLRVGSAVAALMCVVLLTTGCLVMYDRNVKTSGAAVVKASLESVREGATTRDDIIAAFGTPTQCLKLEDGREVLTYVHTRRNKVGWGIIFIVVWKSDSERVIRYHFEFKDDLLVRSWREETA